MRVRTWSACVALAWGILLIITAAGSSGSFRPAQATTRIAGSTSSISSTSTSTSTTDNVNRTIDGPLAATLTSSVTKAAGSAARPARADSYTVQPGDTLSGIAAALGVPGGWPALYAANRRAIGPNPGLIQPGTTLALPGRGEPSRYRVAAGDTLSGIAAAVGVPGGWPALYAANRPAIGPDPNAIRAGTVLTIPRPVPSARAGSHPAGSHPAGSHPVGSRSVGPAPAAPHPASPSGPVPGQTPPTGHPAPGQPAPWQPTPGQPTPRQPTPRQPAATSPPAAAQAPAHGALPRWLVIVLVAAGILIAIAFLTEPALALARRLKAARQAAQAARQAARQARHGHIVLADYERLVVTHSAHDGTVYVFRPPDADPHAILLAARLVLAQDRYEALAGHLGVPAHWPAE